MKSFQLAMLLVATVLMIGCQGTGTANSSQPAAANAPFNTRLRIALAAIEGQYLNVIVGVSHNNSLPQFWENGTPSQDGIPPGDTQVDINSITKTVTGIMAAKLVEQGMARFDETLGDFFDNVPADKSDITLHHLLTHSAGLRGSVGLDSEVLTRDAFLERVFRSKLRSEPGEVYRYSNAGYGVVAAIIEVRSGKTFERYLIDEVLGGLGLNDTGYAAVYDERGSLRTRRGKSIRRASWGGHDPSWNLIGNGGLVSTAHDMMLIRQAVANGRVISEESLAIVQTPHIKEGPAATSFYGYGLVVQDSAASGRYYWHDGGNGRYSAQWNEFPEYGDFIFTAGTGDDAFQAMRTLYAHLYQ